MNKEKIIGLLRLGKSTNEIIAETGCKKSVISFHRTNLGLFNEKDRVIKQLCDFDWSIIQGFYNETKSVRECQKRFGFSYRVRKEAVAKGLLKPPKRQDYNESEIFSEDSACCRSRRKRIIIQERNNTCENCGNRGEWLGSPLSIQLDHINGNTRDNRKSNLRLLCPNCHSQTSTYGSKNFKNRSRSVKPGYVLRRQTK